MLYRRAVRFSPVTVLLASALILTGADSLSAQGPVTIEAQLASWTIVNRFTQDFSGADPVNVPFSQARSYPGAAGLGFRLDFGRWLRMGPGLQVALQEYILGTSGKAFPASAESAVIAQSAGSELAQVAHLLIPAPFLLEFGPAAGTGARAQADLADPTGTRGAGRFGADLRVGPAFLVRVPVWIPEGSGGTSMNGIASYLLGGGRFLYGELGAGASYSLSERTVVSLRLRSYWPLHALWSAEGALFAVGQVPLTDGLVVSAELGIRFRRTTQTPEQ